MRMTYCPNCRTDIRDDLHRCPACTTWLTGKGPAEITFGTIVGAVVVGQIAGGIVLVLFFIVLNQMLVL